jgi:hypothetical protein|tara:strand:- start:446 stop:649 length:204 start_codon:yes stop_codon:yes gene_type:complete
MVLKKKSVLTGRTNSMYIDITTEQYLTYKKGEELIQNVFPYMSLDQREFIISGILPNEWASMFEGDK